MEGFLNMMDVKWTAKFGASFLCLALLGCSSVEEEQQVTTQTEQQIKKHETKPVLQSDVIEAISPLKELNENKKKLNLPSRTENTIMDYTPLTYRLADVMKNRAAKPASFDEKVPVTVQADNDLLEVIIAFKGTLGFDFIIDPGVNF